MGLLSLMFWLVFEIWPWDRQQRTDWRWYPSHIWPWQASNNYTEWLLNCCFNGVCCKSQDAISRSSLLVQAPTAVVSRWSPSCSPGAVHQTGPVSTPSGAYTVSQRSLLARSLEHSGLYQGYGTPVLPPSATSSPSADLKTDMCLCTCTYEH